MNVMYTVTLTLQIKIYPIFVVLVLVRLLELLLIHSGVLLYAGEAVCVVTTGGSCLLLLLLLLLLQTTPRVSEPSLYLFVIQPRFDDKCQPLSLRRVRIV